MIRTGITAALGAALAVCLLPGIAQAAARTDTVSVDGEGKVPVKPDIMILRTGVEVRRPTVAEAYKQTGEAAARLVTVLLNAGIAKKDITTQELSMRPEYVKDAYPQVEGYLGTENLSAVVRRLDQAEEVLKAAAGTGDEVRFDGITFDRADSSQEEAAARELAFRHAEAKAKQFAKLGRRKLGRLISISAQAVDPSPPHILNYPKAAIMADSGAIQPGEGSMRVTVHLVYALA
ncbi:MAG: SIMPL domain-containing protein [Streptosporangiaceae bacterium]